MLLSISIVLLGGILISLLLNKIKVPSLIGLIIFGIVLGYFNILDESLLAISSVIRKIALVVILLKAGLSLDFKVLKKVGRPAILMCFVPATFEIIGFVIFGPLLLHISTVEALVIGAVMGAVSPAVVVPRMGKLMDEKYGTNKGIPQMILAGSSADDVYCIVLFAAFTSLVNENSSFSGLTFLRIPSSILLGIILGIVCGFIMHFIFKKIHMSDMYQLLSLLGVSFLMCYLEDVLADGYITVSSLLGVITMGIVMFALNSEQSLRFTKQYNKLWSLAEIFLFVLVGASVKIEAALSAGIMVIIMVLIGLIFRMIGTFISILGTPLNKKERLFVMLAELPKATVQAGIGGALIGVSGINSDFAYLVLTVSVIGIIICAPLGAFGIDLSYKKLLEKE